MIFTQAFTKAGTTDDVAPTGAPATQFDMPELFNDGLRAGTLAVSFEFLDGGGAEVAGASCSAQLWLQDVASSKWFRCDAKQSNVSGRRIVSFGFPPLNRATKAYLQLTDIAGAPASTKAYVAVTGAMLPGYDMSTGSLKVRDILQRGGEQNALGVHRTILAAIASADGAVSWDDSAALESSSVTKAGPGSLYGFVMSAAGATAAAGWLQFFDAVAVPADGAVPKLVFQMAAQPYTRAEIIPGERRWFPTGICWCISSTPATKTLVTAGALNMHFGHVAYG